MPSTTADRRPLPHSLAGHPNLLADCDHRPPVAGGPVAAVYRFDRFLEPAAADQLHAALLTQINWQQPIIRLGGRLVHSPRLAAWHGDPGAVYTWSGRRHRPQPWPALLLPLKTRLQQFTGAAFNSVLLNRYRSGADSMGWHSDDEPELGMQPTIASLSLGHPRRFLLKPKKPACPCRTKKIELQPGALLLMTGLTQQYWQHAIPKTRRHTAERINLTFRLIHPLVRGSQKERGHSCPRSK